MYFVTVLNPKKRYEINEPANVQRPFYSFDFIVLSKFILVATTTPFTALLLFKFLEMSGI